MNYTNQNLKVCLAAPLEIFTQWRDEHAQDGFRPISLSLAGPTSVPIYTAVMAKHDPPFRSQSWPALSKSALNSKIAELAGGDRQLHPYMVAATGSGNSAIYAASFREMSRQPAVKLDLTAQQYRDECNAQRLLNRMLIWVDAFGTAADIRYCAIWGDNPGNIAWNAEGVNDKGDERQERFDILISIGARPAHVAMTPDGGLARLFVDTRLKHAWDSKASMSADRMQEVMAEQAAAGRFPVRIATAVIDNAVRFSAIFAKSDEIVPRSLRIQGPAPSGLSAADRTKAAALDTWMEDYVRAHAFRGAALAVVDGTRLVFAKGYTFAEPDYPEIEPTTVFRLASVSKAFCSIAAWKALSDDPNHSRNSKMQSILQLKRPDGSTPTGDFSTITMRHLLESCSGIDQASMRGAMAEIKEAGGSQPASVNTLASRVAETAMPGQPGGATSYGRTDYFLLGLVTAKLAGVANFDAALKKLVLDPLHMNRTRGSRTRLEHRASDDATHHLPNMATAKSAVHDDRRLVPYQYGDENYEVFDGAGGISSAVIDVARLCAMFSCRLANPLFSSDTLDEMLQDAVAATNAGSDHGYHGFDSASGTSPHVLVEKGGSLPGAGSGFRGTTGRRFIVILRNGSKKENEPLVDWKTDLEAIAATITWGDDLFPHFNMPSLGVTMQKPPVVRPR